MKIVFLDFDGVINSFDSSYVSSFCLSVLKKIIDLSGAKIVVTSSNKYPVQKGFVDYYKSNLYNNYVKKINDFGLEIFDYTLCINCCRELEIEEYLNNHNDIEQYLILDDDYFFSKHNGHQIFIDLGYGLEREYLDMALSILDGNLVFYDLDKIDTDIKVRCLKSNIKYSKEKK